MTDDKWRKKRAGESRKTCFVTTKKPALTFLYTWNLLTENTRLHMNFSHLTTDKTNPQSRNSCIATKIVPPRGVTVNRSFMFPRWSLVCLNIMPRYHRDKEKQITIKRTTNLRDSLGIWIGGAVDIMDKGIWVCSWQEEEERKITGESTKNETILQSKANHSEY